MPLGIIFDRLSFQGMHFVETTNGLAVSARFIATNMTGDQKTLDMNGLPTGLTPAQEQNVRQLIRRLIGAYARQALGTDTATKRLDMTRDGMITEVDKAAPAVDAKDVPADQFAG